MNKVFDRETKKYFYEKQYAEDALDFLYNHPAGRLLLKIAVSPLFSRLYALYCDSPQSAAKIPSFIKKNNINATDFENRRYNSFNDFFTRKIKPGRRVICPDYSRLISPADSKITVYRVSNKLRLKIKHSEYSVEELLGSKAAAEYYKNGLCLVFRLCVGDYHRYCYVESGPIAARKKIAGKLHTVSPISENFRIFAENTREYCVIKSNRLGPVVQMEVGAMLVGKIENHAAAQAKRGTEKGFFAYGGSTIVVFLRENAVSIDDDIMYNSNMQTETKVKYGEALGNILC